MAGLLRSPSAVFSISINSRFLPKALWSVLETKNVQNVAHKSPWGSFQKKKKKAQTSKRQSLLWSLVPNLFKDKIQQNQHTQQQPLQSSPAASWRQLQRSPCWPEAWRRNAALQEPHPHTVGEAPSPQSDLTDWHLKMSCPCPRL